jgi:hypothetical protein
LLDGAAKTIFPFRDKQVGDKTELPQEINFFNFKILCFSSGSCCQRPIPKGEGPRPKVATTGMFSFLLALIPGGEEVTPFLATIG